MSKNTSTMTFTISFCLLSAKGFKALGIYLQFSHLSKNGFFPDTS